MVEEIRAYMMDRYASNGMRFQDMTDVEVLPNIRRKIEKTSTHTNLWLVMMFDEHIFEVGHLENPADKFSVNLKEHLCSCIRWELTGLPCLHALSAMKSMNHKVDDYIPHYYRKSRYIEVYKHVIFLVNDSNMWVKTEYPDVQPPKYRKMPGRLKKTWNLKQWEIDGFDRKMRRTCFIIKCSRCKKPGHNKLTCKVTPASQQAPTQEF
ncbi:unnamed protein product [Lathyrus sativus]|nr:unnamed protein product [Lathyrus sativus]